MGNKNSYVRYKIEGFTPSEEEFINETLNDPRGWASYGLTFMKDSRFVNFNLYKKSPMEIYERADRDEEFKKLSATFSFHDGRIPDVYINEENWENPPDCFTGSKTEYRQYVIQHEIGHVLGQDHEPEGEEGELCHIMYQQTKGTKKCIPNPWINP